MSSNLSGYVCVVTGASRGVGQGIAIGLGKAGATVYITGRTLSSEGAKGGGSLYDTAHIINAAGGKAIPVAVDHSDDTQVAGLFSRIHKEQCGRLDIFVNCAFSAIDHLLLVSKSPYWEYKNGPGEEWDLVNRVGLRNAYICNVLATRMMIKCREGSINCSKDSVNVCNHHLASGTPLINTTTTTTTTTITSTTNQLPTGLIVNISSFGGTVRIFNVAFCAGKSALDRITQEMARDLKQHKANVSVVSIIPGLVQTESVVSAYESGNSPKLFGYDISLRMAMPAPVLGDLIACLASQSKSKKLLQRSGHCLFAPDLTHEFGIRSADGYHFTNLRSIKTLLQLMGWKKLAILFPGFIKLPYWLIAIFTSKF